MTKVAVVYHSGFGHTKVVAERVAKGASSVDGAEATLHKAEDFNPPKNKKYGPEWDALNEADAIVFGSPTYMGSVSAGLKSFMEATSLLWGQQRWKDKVAGGFTNSGGLSGDKVNALQDIIAFTSQHSMLWVPLGVLPSKMEDPSSDEDLNRLGAWMGAMAQSTNESPEVTPPESDRKTAEKYGARIAEIAKRFNAGA